MESILAVVPKRETKHNTINCARFFPKL